MWKKYSILIFLGLIAFCNSCISPPEYPIEPVITFKSMTKNKLAQSFFNKDSLAITISFTDGDGDIGNNDTTLALEVIDTRDGFTSGKFKIPVVPEQGSGNGISGEIEFVLYTTCCYYPDGTDPCTKSTKFPTDTVIYEILLKDRAGHVSNKVMTDPIVIDCTKN